MAPTATPSDRAHMRRALSLAERGWGRVHPNPLVGAVVVRGEEVVGEGFHGEYGGPHAEVVALRAAGEKARGATLYVTLEPCSHYGKTPPCTDAIVASGVSRVVIAAEDTSPLAGGGAERLRDAGIEVVIGVERDAARALNAAFFHAVERDSPYVALKYGLSLDGRISARRGRPTAVTGKEAHAEVHRLRAGFDAILVGIGTALADDPLLTVRGAVEPRVPPIRVILDSGARLPLDSRLVRTTDEAPVWVICGEDAPSERRAALEARGVRTLAVPRSGRHIPVEAALARIWEGGVQSLFCEGGGRVGGALLEADVVERLYLFFAPRLFGRDGVPAFPGRVPAAVRDGWIRRAVAEYGADVMIWLDRMR